MALSFGWRANEVRESIWKDDPALVGVSKGALESWEHDGDASWLRPFATAGAPTIIRFRSLTADEKHVALSPLVGAGNAVEGFGRTLLRAFRLAVEFEDAPDQIRDAGGDDHRIRGKEFGFSMLAQEIVEDLETRYPGIVNFYGGLIYRASVLTDSEKKASSPQSTATPSSAAGSMADTTAPSVTAEAATGAP